MYRLKHVCGEFCVDEKGAPSSSGNIEWTKAPLTVQNKLMQEIRKDVSKKALHAKSMEFVWQQLQDAVNEDILIIQAVKAWQEEEDVSNKLTGRLREWVEWYDPDLSRMTNDHARFVAAVANHEWKDASLAKRWKEKDVTAMVDFAHSIQKIQRGMETKLAYIESVLEGYAPNILAVTNARLAGQLFELSGGLKKLATLPATTIQLLGAEKALFRHLLTGAKSPKHGIIIQHPCLANAPAKEHGRIARLLADRIAMCARLDYFKGEFKGAEYRREIEEACRR